MAFIPDSLSNHSPSFLHRRNESPQSYTHPYRPAFEWSQPD